MPSRSTQNQSNPEADRRHPETGWALSRPTHAVAPTRELVASQRQIGSATPDELYETLATLARKFQVPGAQLAVHNNGRTTAVSVGELEFGTGISVARDAAFPVGSLTKICTAGVAMILVADGDLDLDSPLGQYLPELERELGKVLTLRHLLSHTGGLPDGPDSSAVIDASVRRYVTTYGRSGHLVLRPGTGFSYSSVGYVVAGHLIESITGMRWQDAVESILMRPLGIEPVFLCSTGRHSPDRGLATGHSVSSALNRTRPVSQSLAPAEAPAGGLALSAADLVGLGLTQRAGGAPPLFPASCAEQMGQVVPEAHPLGLADGWGLGLASFRGGSSTWLGHDGNAHGTACYLRIEPVTGTVVAMTSNASLGALLWRELSTELAGMGVPLPGYSANDDLGALAAPPAGCTGTYVNCDTKYSVIEQDDGDYRLDIDSDAVARLTFHENLVFSSEDIASGDRAPAGRFVRDSDIGDITGIMVGGRVARRKSMPLLLS
ncbi:MAG TPA: serine hydrolase domain-containing protein [Pseudonocardia sp.]|jgi:CubicO group peptidase (beta-lactamase class C family)